MIIDTWSDNMFRWQFRLERSVFEDLLSGINRKFFISERSRLYAINCSGSRSLRWGSSWQGSQCLGQRGQIILVGGSDSFKIYQNCDEFLFDDAICLFHCLYISFIICFELFIPTIHIVRLKNRIGRWYVVKITHKKTYLFWWKSLGKNGCPNLFWKSSGKATFLIFPIFFLTLFRFFFLYRTAVSLIVFFLGTRARNKRSFNK